jgi:hypothetical protein
MTHEPLFKGLVFDENDQLVDTSTIGSDPYYVVNDAGFMRHILSQEVDLKVLKMIGSQINGNEEIIADQTAKMLGQEDLFTHAIIQNQLKNIDKQFDQLLQIGIPEETRAYLGMTGFRIIIDVHGEVMRVEQPTAPANDDDGENGEEE